MGKNIASILPIGVAVVILAAIGYWGATRNPRVQMDRPNNEIKNGPVYCIQDVKQCSDGSWVTRVPPSCEFAACPPTSHVYTPLAVLRESAELDGKVIEVQGVYTMQAIPTGGLGAATPAFQTSEGTLRMNNPASLARIAPGSEVKVRGTYDHETRTLTIPANCAECAKRVQ